MCARLCTSLCGIDGLGGWRARGAGRGVGAMVSFGVGYWVGVAFVGLAIVIGLLIKNISK